MIAVRIPLVRAAILGGALILSAPSPAGEALTAGGILAKMEAAGEKISTLEADFRQTRIYSLFAERRESSGKIYYKKPARMLWKYEAPGTSSIYIDGKTALMYLPDVRQVQKISLFKDRKTESLLIGFSPRADRIKRNFAVSMLADERGRCAIELVPKTEELASQFLRLKLVIDKRSWLPVRTERTEPGGDRTIFTFSAIRTNTPLEDSLFEFEVPEGVEVVAY